MKNLFFVFSLSFVITLGFSCKNNYDCGCVYDVNNGIDTVEEKQKFEILDVKKTDATDYCEGQEASLESVEGLDNVSCVLSEKN